jgi:hypothetical protein
MVEHTVLAGRLSSTGYATAWALVHYLEKAERPKLFALVREASAIPPLSGAMDAGSVGVVRANLDAFTKRFEDSPTALEAKIIAHLKKLPYNDPFEAAPHFVATLVVGNGRRAQRSASSFHFVPMAEKWLTDMKQKLPESERPGAQATIYGFDNRAQAEAYIRQWQAQ